MSEWCERYYRVFEARNRSAGTMCLPWSAELPADMLVGEQSTGGYIEWQFLKPESQEEVLLSQFENAIGAHFPQSFREWFGHYYTLDADCSVVRLPSCPKGNPLLEMNEVVSATDYYKHIRDLGLLPFGEEALIDAGPLCFDTRVERPDFEWPIVYWDHEFDGASSEIGPVLFSSFQKLIECVTTYMDWGRKDWQDRFFDIDPDGAGDSGREYWMSWSDESDADI